jgi:monoterpene epsilon-lactone hydrolase
MTRTRTMILATLAGTSAACGALAFLGQYQLAVAQESSAARKVPAKEVPVPATVSPELAKIIAQPIQKFPLPKTPEEWRTAQQIIDAVQAKKAQELAKTAHVSLKETHVGGVRCFEVTPEEVLQKNEGRLLVHLHGGGYVIGGGLACTAEAILVAAVCKTRALSVDYRMAPDHLFPAALDDAVAVWKAVTKDRAPAKVALFGTSAGGGLTMATVLKLKELKLPMPAVLFVGTPASDLTKTSDSFFTNAEVDNSVGRFEGVVEDSVKLYAGKADLRDPLLSPVYGDFSGFPPTILISGTRDLMLSNTVRAHRKLRAAGVSADLHIYEGQSHMDYLRSYPSPESKDALGEIARFFDAHL